MSSTGPKTKYMKCKLCFKVVNQKDISAHADFHREKGELQRSSSSGTSAKSSPAASMTASSVTGTPHQVEEVVSMATTDTAVSMATTATAVSTATTDTAVSMVTTATAVSMATTDTAVSMVTTAIAVSTAINATAVSTATNPIAVSTASATTSVSTATNDTSVSMATTTTAVSTATTATAISTSTAATAVSMSTSATAVSTMTNPTTVSMATTATAVSTATTATAISRSTAATAVSMSTNPTAVSTATNDTISTTTTLVPPSSRKGESSDAPTTSSNYAAKVDQLKLVNHLLINDKLLTVNKERQTFTCEVCQSNGPQLNFKAYVEHVSSISHMKNVFVWMNTSESRTLDKYQVLIKKLRAANKPVGLFCELCRKASFNVKLASQMTHLASEKHKSSAQMVRKLFESQSVKSSLVQVKASPPDSKSSSISLSGSNASSGVKSANATLPTHDASAPYPGNEQPVETAAEVPVTDKPTAKHSVVNELSIAQQEPNKPPPERLAKTNSPIDELKTEKMIITKPSINKSETEKTSAKPRTDKSLVVQSSEIDRVIIGKQLSNKVAPKETAANKKLVETKPAPDELVNTASVSQPKELPATQVLTADKPVAETPMGKVPAGTILNTNAAINEQLPNKNSMEKSANKASARINSESKLDNTSSSMGNQKTIMLATTNCIGKRTESSKVEIPDNKNEKKISSKSYKMNSSTNKRSRRSESWSPIRKRSSLTPDRPEAEIGVDDDVIVIGATDARSRSNFSVSTRRPRRSNSRSRSRQELSHRHSPNRRLSRSPSRRTKSPLSRTRHRSRSPPRRGSKSRHADGFRSRSQKSPDRYKHNLHSSKRTRSRSPIHNRKIDSHRRRRSRSPISTKRKSPTRSLSPKHSRHHSSGNKHSNSRVSHSASRRHSPGSQQSHVSNGLRTRALSPWSINSLTFLVDKKWKSFYEKYYASGIRDDTLCLILQKDYLQAYKGFFVQDPQFEIAYPVLIQPELLRSMLTERIENGPSQSSSQLSREVSSVITVKNVPMADCDALEPGEIIDDERKKELDRAWEKSLARALPPPLRKPAYTEKRPSPKVTADNYTSQPHHNTDFSTTTVPVSVPKPVPPPEKTSDSLHSSGFGRTPEDFHSFDKLQVLIREKLKLPTVKPPSPTKLPSSIEVPDLVKQALKSIKGDAQAEYPTTSMSSDGLVFRDPFLGFVHNVLSGILKMTGLQDDVDSGAVPSSVLTELHYEQRRMHESMVTPEGHLLIRMARMSLTNRDRLHSKFGSSHADVVGILENLDRDVLQLIADTPMLKQ
ncbi:hypothetical protein EB796_023433 [Bugula neritina]|uniref:Uncharacterized protein n=1 Tax=Bugula neritina TaxID=10212 RepID=A0A7J7IXX8_BUGNE|nr:hypothetical protein EB796_023433 [Bugula neritina]